MIKVLTGRKVTIGPSIASKSSVLNCKAQGGAPTDCKVSK